MPGKSYKKRHTKKRRSHKNNKRHTNKRHTNKRRSHKNNKRRHNKRSLRGGSGNGMYPLIGSPYNTRDEVPSGNYIAPSPVGVPAAPMRLPEPSNSQFGGRRKSRSRKSKGKKMRGGNFFSSMVPMELLNMGRSIPAAAGHMYDKFSGLNSSASSMVYPTDQPAALSGKGSAGFTIAPPNINSLYSSANNTVAGL